MRVPLRAHPVEIQEAQGSEDPKGSRVLRFKALGLEAFRSLGLGVLEESTSNHNKISSPKLWSTAQLKLLSPLQLPALSAWQASYRSIEYNDGPLTTDASSARSWHTTVIGSLTNPSTANFGNSFLKAPILSLYTPRPTKL